MLIVTVIYLDKYHGKEWPPSPFRWFQALIAAAKTGYRRVQWSTEKEDALRWLESLSPPTIVATPARPAPSYLLSVPNNDMDVAAGKWSVGKEVDPAKLRTMKPVNPWWPETGRLAVQYRWDPPAAEEVHLAIIREEARHITHLGWGVDMVAVSAEKSQPLSDGLLWRPEGSKDIRGTGQELWCPKPGSWDDLEGGYQQTCNRVTTLDFTWRPTVRERVRYVCDASVISRPWTAFSMVRLTDDRTVAWDGIRQIEIAAMARHAVGELFEKEGFPDSWRRIFVQGHGDTKEQKDTRLSYVPLPTIGREHVDGGIRRLLVVGPSGGDRDILERVQWGLPAVPLSKDGVPRVRLTGPQKGDKVLRQYTATAETWMSVTPVILPAYGDPAEALFRAMEHVGIKPDAVENVWYQNMPFWAGSSPSWSYKVANYMHYPRYHVRVRFRQPVTGPLVMGRGRHYGLGVMAAER